MNTTVTGRARNCPDATRWASASTRHSARQLLLGVASCIALALALIMPSQGAAVCNENGSLFWRSVPAGVSALGTQQAILTRSHSNGGCGEANNIVAGATSHLSLSSGLVEIGYRDFKQTNGAHFFRVFTEYCIGAACAVPFTSTDDFGGCVAPDTQPTYRVDQIGNRVYRFTLYCPTATWSINPDTPQLCCGSGSPRVETFRFGPAGGGGTILDYHTNLYYHLNSGWVAGFGTMACSLGMSDTRGQQVSSSTWQTIAGNGCP